MSGGVNNDNLLYLAAAGTLWALARAFRRGLTVSSGALLGGIVGAGLVSKLTLLGFVPAVALALVLLVRRAPAGERRPAATGALVAVAVGAAPLIAYALLNHLVWDRSFIPGGVGAVGSNVGRHFSFREEISHLWQLFLPRLWMRPQFTYSPLWHTWFVGFVGRFGWLDYGFPAWVYQLARVIMLGVLALAIAELVRSRAAVRARAAELAVYALAVVGLCVEIGIESYRYLIANGGVFEQPRYLLPLLGLYAAIGAIAVRLGGRRWGPVIAAVLVALAIGHDLYAQAITIARYYA
jgi:4-amino-4-deoxy-L-arabinose transferase-like glycosyltransferase